MMYLIEFLIKIIATILFILTVGYCLILFALIFMDYRFIEHGSLIIGTIWDKK